MTSEPSVSLEFFQGQRALVFDQIDSTNEEALRLIRAGRGEDGLWLLAKSQTSGRGRLGREWLSEGGNFFASVLVKSEIPRARAPEFSFTAALAVAKALDRIVGDAGLITLKWPNDILLNGNKVSGILVESETRRGGAENWLVVGIGINITGAPEGVRFPATHLQSIINENINNIKLLEELSQAWKEVMERLYKEGFEVIKEAWLKRAAGLGKTICAKVGEDDFEGIFEGLGAGGALVLALADGTRKEILSGEILELKL